MIVPRRECGTQCGLAGCPAPFPGDATLRFSISCALDYVVTAPTTMILNIEAMGSPQQKIGSAKFSVEPFVPADLSQAFEAANAYRRLVLPPGSYAINYRGAIDSEPFYADPSTIGEVPIANL